VLGPSIIQIVRDIFANTGGCSNTKVLEQARTLSIDREGITIEKFLVLFEKWELLMPVFALQKSAQTKIVGVAFWTRLANKKIGGILSEGKFMGTAEYVRNVARRKVLINRRDSVTRKGLGNSTVGDRRGSQDRNKIMQDKNDARNGHHASDKSFIDASSNRNASDTNGFANIVTVIKQQIDALTGSHHSQFYKDAPDYIRHLKKHFKAMQLQESEVSRLHEFFKKIDIRKVNMIEQRDLEIFHLIDMAEFDARVFEVWDSESRGNLDFLDFFGRLWDLCSGGRATAGEFVSDAPLSL
jgi:hypothetical protein